MSTQLLAQNIDFNAFRTAFPSNSLPANANLTIGTIISSLLPYLLALAGLMLLAYLIIGGFGLMTSGGDPKKADSAKQRITYALVGFIIVFISFWLIQVVEVILGLPKVF